MSERTQKLIAIGAVVVAVVAIAADNLAFRAVDESPAFVRFLILSLLCVAVAAAIFLYLLPALRGSSAEGNRLARAGFVLGLVALASIIVFWTGLPFVLGAGAVVMGRLGEQHAKRRIERIEQSNGDEQSDGEEQSGDDENAGERATEGWAAVLMGGLSAAGALVLFVIVVAL